MQQCITACLRAALRLDNIASACRLTRVAGAGSCKMLRPLSKTNATWRKSDYLCARWDPNPPDLSRTPALCEPWGLLPRPAVGATAATTYNSQPTFVLPYPCASGRTVLLYMGDRWNFRGPGGVRTGRLYISKARLQQDIKCWQPTVVLPCTCASGRTFVCTGKR